ncbi:MAG: tRNA (adenosine(37)-N6)-dimethylallyltransferase MiaA [Caldilineaceae bacterium SB0675_bin_29]|uniref:tRNA dimethylallyltransferase n=1 Tax=Caldilineaceae bacterium SB0675_bin_29 TaxID=2605266 RepID=A0A6B1G513_9CHLR|nr:tRNA (adenosine(37)-N6)-dimethylallyltransferase MiaA [Caldilineaceae bacterium SB0675_bin_29]
MPLPDEQAQEKAQPPLIVILGPTAVGKTSLSLDLAARFDGEIVGADSRQIYHGMDIGTAKPSAAEQARVPHHLVDIQPPDSQMALATYQQMAFGVIDAIHKRGRVPFLVGGSALYLRAVTEGLQIPEAPPNPALRAELEKFAQENGRAALHARLQESDPDAAAQFHPNNMRRVIRALEIVQTTGRRKSELESAAPPPYRILKIGLELPRPLLHERIDRRVHEMVAAGLVEEMASLLSAGYSPDLPSLSSLGYQEVAAHLRGEMTLTKAVERIQIETHRFVRHQYTWFRRIPDIHWYDISEAPLPAIRILVERFLQRNRIHND